MILESLNETLLVDFKVKEVNQQGKVHIKFSEEVSEERTMTLNETCFQFEVFPNEYYFEMMRDWKESDPKVIIIDRNLSILNHTIGSVSEKDMYIKLNFAEND